MERSSITRAKILDCAKRLYSQSGYHDTQISDIIQDVKIGRGTVYQYFNNKEHIFISLLELFYDEWEKVSAIDISLEELRSMTARDYLRIRLGQTFNYFDSDHDRANIILRTSLGLGGPFETKVSRLEKKITVNITNDLKLGIRNGHIHENIDLEFASNFIAGAIFRISFHYFVKNRSQKKAKEMELITEKAFNMVAPAIFIKSN